MTENEHTPKPWKRHLTGDGKAIIIDGSNRGPYIALVYYDDCDWAEAEANADVILAAPDMLEACELQEHADRLRTVWLCNQAVPGYDSSEDRRAWHEALGLAEEARRAAIDKARGNDVPTDA